MILDERLSVFLDGLQWQLPDYLAEMEAQAIADGVPVIRRSMQMFLKFLLGVVRPEYILEVGTAVGFSGLLMSEYAPEGTKITTIEKVPARILEAKKNFQKYGAQDRITLLEGDAADVLAQLSGQGRQFDFVFLDAAKGQYLHFMEQILELLPQEGILITDNVLQDGDVLQSRYAVTRRDRTIHGRMREYLYTLTHSEQFDSVILPVGDGVAVSRRKA